MTSLYIFDRKEKKIHPIDVGNEKDLLLLKAWSDNDDNRKVQRTEYTDGIYVSTVFLMVNHRFLDEGAPILWETMIQKAGEFTEWSRYDSYEKAVEGHKKACLFVERKIKEATFPWYLFWKRWKREDFFEGADQ